jgi:hypothetical protein
MNREVQSALIDLAGLVLPTLIAVSATLGGVWLGHRYAKEQARASKALDFIERRITQFYSPMVGCIKRIRALSELRVEVSRAGHAAWAEICDTAPKPFLDHDKRFEPFQGIIGYENAQLYKDILPAYERMVTIFTDHYWLADDEVRRYYAELCRFVELWLRFKANVLPYEVLVRIEHSEERLRPLYVALEERLAELTAVVAHKPERRDPKRINEKR